jgi:hypothetical protein
MVLHEVTRNATPTREKIAQWVALQAVEIVRTRTYAFYQTARLEASAKLRKSNLVKLAIQETMDDLALAQPNTTSVLLYRTIAEHLETWLELASVWQFDGQGDHHTPPAYVEKAFRKYLECGIFILKALTGVLRRLIELQSTK